ncbi:unnamed protein product [Urochloa decumbens]|uniref:F-box domain-containing protein n=1 Tax=Urochloa decumbens TaxID=240449 RepID=A0ABC9BTR3_9POAL
MPSSSASRRRGRNQPAPPAARPEAVEEATGPAAVPRLPPPAGFARKPDPAPAASAVERAATARCPVAAPSLPPPAAFARRPSPAPRAASPNPSPPEPQARPPTPPPSSSSSRRRRRRRRKARDWASLPRDALGAILGKLDHIEILMGAGQVCRSWRGAAREDPSLWRRVDMRGHADLFYQVNLHGMAQAAVRRADGQCEAFWGEYAGDDDFLLFLAEQAPSLKSLRLISCYDVSNEGLAEAIKKLPMLEELELSLSSNVFGQEVYETVGKSCSQLKRFRLSKHSFYSFDDVDYNKDGEALGIATMTGLRSLQIFGNNLTNAGLTVILDNCHHLESLDIRHCFNVEMDNTLRAKCAGIKTLRLPDDSTDDYEFIVSPPVWANHSQSEDDSDDGYMGSDVYYELDTELDDDDDIYDPSNYIDGMDPDDEEARMILRGLWAIMK